MNQARFRRRLFMVQLLVWWQRALRLSLRAAWSGVAGYMLAWGISSLYGRPSDPDTWLLAGVILASFSFWGLFYPWPRAARLAWRLDQAFGLREQVSAAQQVAGDKSGGQIGDALLIDAASLLSRAWLRIAWRGWFLERDLVSIVVASLLFWLIFTAYSPPGQRQLPMAEALSLRPLGQDPTAEQVFPDGIPGLTPEMLAASPPAEVVPTVRQEAAEGVSPEQHQAMMAALRNLGRELSQQAVSYDIGQALQRGNMSDAAQAMEALADQASQLSEETREDLARALQRAAQQIAAFDETGRFQELTEALESAAQALRDEDAQASADRLDEAAKALRNLAEELQDRSSGEARGDSDEPHDSQSDMGDNGGTGSGASVSGGERGGPEPVGRLQGEGQLLELGGANDESGALRPGRPPEAGSRAVEGAFQALYTTGDEAVVSTALTPYSYPWVWRNVVSSYFTPR
jgi:hypothetical protein